MRLYVTETISNIVEVEEIETIFEIADFDTGFGKIPESIFDAKGDLIAGTDDDTYARVGAGSDGQYLQADSTQTAGIKWASVSAGGTVEMTNKSGDSVAAGDVVIFDVDNDEAFETTTNPSDTRAFGIASEDIANNAVGNIYSFAGYIATVNCDTGAVSRGEFLVTSTTAKKAKSGGYFRVNGAFAVALTAKAAGDAGTVKAMLIQEFTRAVAGAGGWAMGGYDTAVLTNTQKFTIAAGTWATVAGAALPEALYDNDGIAETTLSAYSLGGYTSYSAKAYKLPFATETMAAQASADLGTARSRLRSGGNGSTKGYCLGGYTGSNSALTDIIVYATSTRSAGNNLSSARTFQCGMGDGTYIYIQGGVAVTSDRITLATDGVAAHADSNLAASADTYTAISFPASAGYIASKATVTASRKIPYATGVAANTNALDANSGNGFGITDGLAYGWLSGDDASPFSVSNKFTLATETYATDAAAAMAVGKFRGAYGNNGAL